MRVSTLGLDYSAGPGTERRTVCMQLPKATMHRVKLLELVAETGHSLPSVSVRPA